jgi:hypothetical protein
MERSEVLYLSFNQDASYINVGTSNGFKIFKAFPLELIYQWSEGGFKIVEIHESS